MTPLNENEKRGDTKSLTRSFEYLRTARIIERLPVTAPHTAISRVTSPRACALILHHSVRYILLTWALSYSHRQSTIAQVCNIAYHDMTYKKSISAISQDDRCPNTDNRIIGWQNADIRTSLGFEIHLVPSSTILISSSVRLQKAGFDPLPPDLRILLEANGVRSSAKCPTLISDAMS